MGKFIDLTGQRFGRLIVLKYIAKSKWKCLCDCGNEKLILSSNLKNGDTKSCGCLSRENSKKQIKIAHEKNKIELGQSNFNHLYSQYKSRAKRKKIIFNLSKEEFKNIVLSPCFYSGLPPNQIRTQNKFSNGGFIYNGIDRIDSKKGYILDNVVACAGWINYLFGNKDIYARIQQIENILLFDKESIIFNNILKNLRKLI